MIMEICIGVVSIAFVVLVIFLIMTLRDVSNTLKQSKQMIRNFDELIANLKEKSQALDLFFKPLEKLSKKKAETKNLKNYEKAAEVINFATDGILLFNKLKRKH